jgi:hypothetical protein
VKKRMSLNSQCINQIRLSGNRTYLDGIITRDNLYGASYPITALLSLERVLKFAAIGVKLVCAENRRVVRYRYDTDLTDEAWVMVAPIYWLHVKAAARPQPICVRSSTPSFVFCEPVAHGDCCRVSSQPGAPSTVISVLGKLQESGYSCIATFMSRCVSRRVSNLLLLQ